MNHLKLKVAYYAQEILHRIFYESYNFSQVLYKLPEDGRRPKHVGAIIMCILV